MSRLFEFQTPEGPDFIFADHISRIRPAGPFMSEAGTDASLVYVVDGPTALVRGKAADLARAVEAARANFSLAERLARLLGPGAQDPRTGEVALLAHTRARTELAIAKRQLAEHELAGHHPEGATGPAIGAEVTRAAVTAAGAAQAPEALAGERL